MLNLPGIINIFAVIMAVLSVFAGLWLLAASILKSTAAVDTDVLRFVMAVGMAAAAILWILSWMLV